MVESVESADGTSIEYDEYGSGDASVVVAAALVSQKGPQESVDLPSALRGRDGMK